MFIDIEDDHNRLAFRFDPELLLIELKTKHMKSPQVFDIVKICKQKERIRALQAVHCSKK